MMEKRFWMERWEKNETGFHQEQVNPYLIRYWPELGLARGGEVFVPLCGKSLDMHWLREQGHFVTGVELSDIAVHAFFDEYGYVPYRTHDGRFDIREAEGVRLMRGDFFELAPADLAVVTAVYDRAALVALPSDMRRHYVSHLARILPPLTRMLLVTFEYPQNEMSGPPFSVPTEEVRELYRGFADIRLLSQQDLLEANPRFRERGLSRMQESVWMLTVR